jgi:hypothetical protein
MGEMKKGIRNLVRKPAGKMSLGRYMRRWEDNIGMVLRTWTNGGLL